MAEFKDLALAKATFETLCKTLDSHEWYYEKNEEKLSVNCSAKGDDFPVELEIEVDADRMLVMLISHLPFTIKEDKRLDAAIAISVVNNMMLDGCFDFDIRSGHIFFRMTNSFIESTLGQEYFTYLLFCACQTIDEYNDKFLMIEKGVISVEQFIASELDGQEG